MTISYICIRKLQKYAPIIDGLYTLNIHGLSWVEYKLREIKSEIKSGLLILRTISRVGLRVGLRVGRRSRSLEFSFSSHAFDHGFFLELHTETRETVASEGWITVRDEETIVRWVWWVTKRPAIGCGRKPGRSRA